LGYVQYCHDVEGYDEKEVDVFMEERLEWSGRPYEKAKEKAKARKR